MAAKYDITIQVGNDQTISLALKQADGTAYDLTGKEVIFRAEWTGGSMRYTSETVGSGSKFEIIDDAAGLVSLVIDPAGSRLFPDASTTVNYEIELRDDGAESTLLYGRVSRILGVNDDG